METVAEVTKRLLERAQKESNYNTNQSQVSPQKNCPFSLCDGSGLIVTLEDGLTYARNCKCVKQTIIEAKITKTLKFANIPHEFEGVKVDDFNCTIYTTSNAINIATAARKITKNYILNFEQFKETGKGLYYYSKEKGSGKTMLALALGNVLINMYKMNVKFVTTPDLFAEIKRTYDKTSEFKESELLDSLKSVQVLILDDIGTEKQGGWVNEILYQILNTRMTSGLITIFTSNVHMSQLKHDDRIKSRIEKMSFSVQMPEESIRKQIANRENEEMAAALLS